RALHNPPGRYHANPLTEARGSQQWIAPQGFFGPLATIALAYNEYLQRFGATRATTARIAVEAPKNGAPIPWPYWDERPPTAAAAERRGAREAAAQACRLSATRPLGALGGWAWGRPERGRDPPNSPGCRGGSASAPAVARRLHGLWALDDMIEMGAEIARRLY